MMRNNRMRFSIRAYGGEIYSPDKNYSLSVMEYADVCEGETQTAREVECDDIQMLVNKIITNELQPNELQPNEIPVKKNGSAQASLLGTATIAYIEEILRETFESLDAFITFCKQHDIPYNELPFWVDTHSFNEYTGEHRGEYAPFAD